MAEPGDGAENPSIDDLYASQVNCSKSGRLLDDRFNQGRVGVLVSSHIQCRKIGEKALARRFRKTGNQFRNVQSAHSA
jgi:hypothetical protein